MVDLFMTITGLVVCGAALRWRLKFGPGAAKCSFCATWFIMERWWERDRGHTYSKETLRLGTLWVCTACSKNPKSGSNSAGASVGLSYG